MLGAIAVDQLRAAPALWQLETNLGVLGGAKA
jgi:hypothetical protein